MNPTAFHDLARLRIAQAALPSLLLRGGNSAQAELWQ